MNRRNFLAALLCGASAAPAHAALLYHSAVSLSPVSPPSGYGYTPPYTISRSNGGTYSTNYDPTSTRPAYQYTVYVGSGGSNSADGLTWATRVRSLNKALAIANALGVLGNGVRILAQAGQYRYTSQDGNNLPDSFSGQTADRNLLIEPCDALGAVVTSGDIISIHDITVAAFTYTGQTGIYVSANSPAAAITPCVWDAAFLNASSNPQALRNVPTAVDPTAPWPELNSMASAYGQGAVYRNTTTGSLYVKLQDNRAPDTNITVGRGTVSSLDASSRNLYIPGIYDTLKTVWMRNVQLWAGATCWVYAFVPNFQRMNIYFNSCQFCYSSYNGATLMGDITSISYGCSFSDSFEDGIGYTQPDGAGAFGTFGNEINCSHLWCGNDSLSDTSKNASSSHASITVARVNGYAYRTQNRAFHDIENSKSWNLGITASTCRQTGDQSGPFVAGYSLVGSNLGTSWFDGCSSVSNAKDLEVYNGATLLTRNMNTAGFNNVNSGGTIGTY